MPETWEQLLGTDVTAESVQAAVNALRPKAPEQARAALDALEGSGGERVTRGIDHRGSSLASCRPGS